MRQIFTITSFALLATSSLLSAEEEELTLGDIPYGIEALVNYRSEYNHRGFILAQDTTDLQISAEYAFNKTTSISAAAWLISTVGDEDFSETGFLADVRKNFDLWTFSLSSEYRSYSDSFFKSGVNLQGTTIYHLSDSVDLSASIAYDTGAEGWHGDAAGSYYLRLSDEAYLNFSGGVSIVSDYYNRDGWNDLFAKVAYTYNINSSISITPYIGTSILLDSEDSDSLYGGLYFAVSF